MKRIISAVLALMLILSLFAGCAKDEQITGGEHDLYPPNRSRADEPEIVPAGYVYNPTYLTPELDERIVNIFAMEYYGGKFYAIVRMITGVDTEYRDENDRVISDTKKIENGEYAYSREYDVLETRLCTMNIDGSGMELLPNYSMSLSVGDAQGDASIEKLLLTSDGELWICENVELYHFDENNKYYSDGSANVLRLLDATGTEIQSIDLDEIISPGGANAAHNVSSIAVDSGGLLYVLINIEGNSERLFIIRPDGTHTEIPCDSWAGELITLGDGGVALNSHGDEGSTLELIDPEAAALSEKYILPVDANQLYRGNDEYDLFYNKNQMTLEGYDLESGESIEILNWIDCGIDVGETQYIIPLGVGRLMAVQCSYRTGLPEYEFTALTAVDLATLPVKTVLTCATIGNIGDVKEMVSEYNKYSAEYRIELIDYAADNSLSEYEDAINRLALDINTGKVPDLFLCHELPLDALIAAGYVEDLKPYIENDPELGMDALLSGAANALTVNGGIYQAAATFDIFTVCGDSAVIGEEAGWTLEEMLALYETLPNGVSVFDPTAGREYIISMMINSNAGDYVNYDAGKCDFDNESFIELLEFTKSLPTDIVYDGSAETPYRMVDAGKILAYPTTLNGETEAFRIADAVLNGRLVFKGFPSPDASSGSFARFNDGIAMSSACEHKDAAWQFLRSSFTGEDIYNPGQNSILSGGFPVNKAVYEEMIAALTRRNMATDADGNEYERPRYPQGLDDYPHPIYAMSEAQADKLTKLIDSLEPIQSFDGDLYAIILEELAPFYENQKSAAEAAEIIQSRAEIYISERK